MAPGIIIRMTKNAAVLAVVLAGCGLRDPGPDAWQGIVEFDERVLAFEIAGRIASIAVDEGDEVDAGSELAVLDSTLDRLTRDARAAQARAVAAELALLNAGSRPEDVRSLQAELAAAKASEALARRSVDRQRQLTNQGIGSTSDLDAAETAISTASANRRDLEARLARARNGARVEEIEAAQARVEAAQADVRAAEERIARHVLRSDARGSVLDVHLEPNEFAQVGAAVVTIADIQHPYVDVFVPQERMNGVDVGDTTRVRVDGREASYDAAVEYIGRQTEFTPKFLFSDRERPNLVLRVRMRIDAPVGDLHAGVPAFVEPIAEAS